MSRTLSIAALAALAAAIAGCANPVPDSTSTPASVASAASVAPAARATGCNAAALPQALLQRINEARRAGLCGDARLGASQPLSWQPVLAATASRRAGEIAQRGSFGNVADVSPRLKQAGYQATSAQESQVAGDFSSDGAALALLGQARQCTTLLNPAYTDIGASCVTRPGTEFGHYWTVVVAKGTPSQSAMGAGAARKPAAAATTRAAPAKAKSTPAPRAKAKPRTTVRAAAPAARTTKRPVPAR